MKILLTGSTGLLGQALVPNLRKNHELFCITRRSPHVNLENAERVSFICQDLLLPLDFSKLPEKIDVVIHAAQSPDYKNFPKAAQNLFAINVSSTFQLMEYARQAGAKLFLYTSTGSVYENDYSLTSEETPPSPHSFYPTTKLASEVLLNTYKSFFKVCVMRLFFLYGKQIQKDKLMHTLAEKIKNKIPIYLEGTQGLEFTPTYNEDVADLISKALSEDWDGCLNVASPKVVTLKELALKIGELLGQSPQFECFYKKTAPRIIPDLSRLSLLWPSMKFTDLTHGLSQTFN